MYFKRLTLKAVPRLPEIVHCRIFKVTTALCWLILLSSFIITNCIKKYYNKLYKKVTNVKNTEKCKRTF